MTTDLSTTLFHKELKVSASFSITAALTSDTRVLTNIRAHANKMYSEQKRAAL